ILSTNIAETSITIPDVRFVVDTGLAKVPRVQARTGITTLREEGISQASAHQRSGRAGRTSAGEAVRLYGARDLAQRPQFTDEEISRLDLSDVFLRLIDHGVERVETFPFPTRPPAAKVRAALRKLRSLGAIDDDQQLTHIGRRMVPFPLSPQLARMVIEAVDNLPDVVDDVLVVGAFLSGRRPYLFPQDQEHAARAAHRHLAHPLGDAPTDILTYRGWIRAKDPDRYCERNFLDPDTMAFIHKTYTQLRDIAEQMNIEIRSGGPPMSVNRAVAAGLPDQLLMAKGRTLIGPGDATISIHPSSSLYGSHERFVVAGELVVSTRTYARWVSVIKREWIAELNPDLAAQWRIRPGKGKGKGEEREEQANLPSELSIRGVTLPVSVRRGEARVEIPIEAVESLKGATPEELPGNSASWKSRVSSGRHRFAQGLPLGTLIELLPLIPLPAPDAKLPRDAPDGAMLEVDRNLHTLERYLPRLMEPCLPGRGKRPGWLTLAASGEGVYW
ncbi:MAG: oligonucleotide/oligosaccharide-binding fold domain-containing protein, partial [Myxococcota bacterium]|nr:oligonucleotide/oligosaccharide-binding fold domain-containing protein [Myxococcota bacterium]